VIFQRSLLREFGSYAAAVFSVLLAIVVTSQLVRLLARAAGGKIPSDAILALIGFTAMNYLPILLALTLFVSVLMTVSRSYKDSEMVVWSTSGVSLLAWVRPVLTFAAPIILLSALLGLFLSPWSNDRAQEYRRKLDSREEVSRIALACSASRPTRSACSSSKASTARRARAQRVHREQQARQDRRHGEPRGLHRSRRRRRPLRRPAERTELRRDPGHR
jgi:hypothetical protein